MKLVTTNEQSLFYFLVAVMCCLRVRLVIDVSPSCQMAPSPCPLPLSPPSLTFEFYNFFFVLGAEAAKWLEL